MEVNPQISPIFAQNNNILSALVPQHLATINDYSSKSLSNSMELENTDGGRALV